MNKSMRSGVILDKVSTGTNLGEEIEVSREDYRAIRKSWLGMLLSEDGELDSERVYDYESARIRVKTSGITSKSYLARHFQVSNSAKDTKHKYIVVQASVKRLQSVDANTGEEVFRYFLNVEGNPTVIASGQNIVGVRLEAGLLSLMRLPFDMLFRLMIILSNLEPRAVWSGLEVATLNKIKTGEGVLLHSIQPDMYTANLGDRMRNKVVDILGKIALQSFDDEEGNDIPIVAYMKGIKEALVYRSPKTKKLQTVTFILKGSKTGKACGSVAFYKKDEESDCKEKSSVIRMSICLRSEALASIFRSDKLSGLVSWVEENGEVAFMSAVLNYVLVSSGISHVLAGVWPLYKSRACAEKMELLSPAMRAAAICYAEGGDRNKVKSCYARRSDLRKEILRVIGWDINYPYTLHSWIHRLRVIAAATDNLFVAMADENEKRVLQELRKTRGEVSNVAEVLQALNSAIQAPASENTVTTQAVSYGLSLLPAPKNSNKKA